MVSSIADCCMYVACTGTQIKQIPLGARTGLKKDF